MDASLNIEGAKELEALLKSLDEKVARKAAEVAVRAGANVIRKAIREKAPGRLKKLIVVRKDKYGPSSVNFKIGTSKKAPYAHLVEFGTSPHDIEAGTKRGADTGKKALSDGNTVYGTTVHHPGAKAEPFFRPGLDESKEAALAKMTKVMQIGLAKAAAKSGDVPDSAANA